MFDVEFPETVEKAVERLKQILSKEDIEYIRSMKEEEEVISMHMTLGNWIRNSFGLWSMNGPLRNSCFPDGPKDPRSENIEPDDCSHEILKALWRDLQTKQ
jgi:hypothetical protein